MKAFRIQNFKYGLDTRREQLTSQPGTLLTGENLEITPGGEAAKRKAFSLNGDTGILDSNSDTGTFGLEVTGAGLIVFGSALPISQAYTTANGVATVAVTGSGSGATFNITAVNGVITVAALNAAGAGYGANDYIRVTQGGSSGPGGALIQVNTVSAGAIATFTLVDGQFQKQPVIVSAMPNGYTYQQLKHPILSDSFTLNSYSGTNRVTYDRTKHRITAIPFSNNYNGNAFVAATFSDGNTFLYYNGTYISQSGSGRVWSSLTTSAQRNAYIAFQIGKQFEALTGWGNGTTTVDPLADTSAANLVEKGIGCPGSSTFTMAATVGSSVGTGNLSAVTGNLATTNVAASGNSTASFTVATGAIGKTYRVFVYNSEGYAAANPVLPNPSAQISGGALAPVSLTSPQTVNGVGGGSAAVDTATAIVTAINALTAVTGYSASNGATATVTVTGPRPTLPTLGTYSLTIGVNVGLQVVSNDGTTNGNKPWSTVSYTNAFGQRGNIAVSETWSTGDTWTISVASSTQGNITIGNGNISGQPFNFAMKLGNREFLGCGTFFAFSSVQVTQNKAGTTPVANTLSTLTVDPTGWEEQNIGAGAISFINQYGAQDTVQSFSHLQGRLAVFGKQSIQMWTVDADPNNFALIQTLDNTGTIAPFSVQAVGDYDAYYLDSPGVRSLRAREVTLNAFTDDVGIAIDQTIQAALVGYDTSGVCSIVEPTKRQYWLYLNGTIYVLSNYPTSKVIAWSTFIPSYDPSTTLIPSGGTNYDSNGRGLTFTFTDGRYYVWTTGANEVNLTQNGTVIASGSQFKYTAGDTMVLQGVPNAAYSGTLVEHYQSTFTPVKFVVYNKQVYVRDNSGKVYVYGGSDNNTYDRCQATLELPYLTIGEGSTEIRGMGVDAAIKGNWDIYANMQPKGPASFTNVIPNKGSTTTPDVLADSTYDTGHYGYSGYGTHFKLKAISGPYPTAAKISGLTFLYDTGQTK